MGTPYFKIKHLKHKIAVYSSNYTLYGDMSRRVVDIIRQFETQVEEYSIDEVFVQLKPPAYIEFKTYLHQIRDTILQCTGLPVSIGVGKTKTLAKVASYQAKKILQQPVCILESCMPTAVALRATPIQEVWGIGRQWHQALKAYRIKTAADLAQMAPHVMKQSFNGLMADTVRELQGESCIPLELITPAKKNIMSSKSFGQTVQHLPALFEALATYTTRAAEKLRQQGSVCQGVTVFLKTNRFNPKAPYVSRSQYIPLPMATDDTGTLIRYAKAGLTQIYEAGREYQKTGIMLCDLSQNTQPTQGDLFTSPALQTITRKQNRKACDIMDKINAKYGKNTLHLGATKTHPEEHWQMRSQFKSPCYTTRWQELLTVWAK